jgi:DNA-binding NtrC family response regulator
LYGRVWRDRRKEEVAMAKMVLIVDDDEPTQTLLQALMRRSGVPSMVAPNGGAAIEILDARDDIGCMILDLMMPAVDGDAVIDHVTRNRYPVPVIICTAAGSSAIPAFNPDVVRAIVRKPFDIDQLMRTVSDVMSL